MNDDQRFAFAIVMMLVTIVFGLLFLFDFVKGVR